MVAELNLEIEPMHFQRIFVVWMNHTRSRGFGERDSPSCYEDDAKLIIASILELGSCQQLMY